MTELNTPAVDAGPAISASGLTIYFHSNRPGGVGEGDLYYAKRASLDDSFGKPANLGEPINSRFNDFSPDISSDGLTLFFSSNRPGGLGGNDLYMAPRNSIGEPFGAPVNLGDGVNTGSNEGGPCISADGLTLYYMGGGDLWRATRPTVGSFFASPVNLGINTEFAEWTPSLTANGLTLYFCSNRPGGLGGMDLWFSTRQSVAGPFGEPVNLGSSVNSSFTDKAPAISTDGATLYFTSNRSSSGRRDMNIWVWEVSNLPRAPLDAAP